MACMFLHRVKCFSRIVGLQARGGCQFQQWAHFRSMLVTMSSSITMYLTYRQNILNSPRLIVFVHTDSCSNWYEKVWNTRRQSHLARQQSYDTLHQHDSPSNEYTVRRKFFPSFCVYMLDCSTLARSIRNYIHRYRNKCNTNHSLSQITKASQSQQDIGQSTAHCS